MKEFKHCRHIMPSGLQCQSPAMRGSAFCYFHGRTPRPARQVKPLETKIEIPPVIGSSGCALAVNHIMRALASNRISPRRAAVLLQAVQMASTQSTFNPAEFEHTLGKIHPQESH